MNFMASLIQSGHNPFNPKQKRAMNHPLVEAAVILRHKVDALSFSPPVSCVYNPLTYAWKPYAAYLARWGTGMKRVVFLGMNPGPWGMAQVGVPFGEVGMIRDWVGIEEAVEKPAAEHPKRPIEGFGCRRSEVSGRRLWGLFAERFGRPEQFFRDHFVANYCPLVFMAESGANITPDKLPAAELEPLTRACDEHLRRMAEILQPQWLIGIGKFAAARASAALQGRDVRVASILHPSPASPAANRGWAAAAEKELRRLGVW
jgi:single-strand selective monofunctional uracil DNA glycosylase